MTGLASSATGMLAAWIPFLHPIDLPPGARMWMFLPLVLCIAIVYRATRAPSVRRMPRATAVTFVNIVLGMVAIAVAFYGVHQTVLWFAAPGP